MLQTATKKNAAIEFNVLLDYLEEEAQNWEKFFQHHPEALTAKIDIAQGDDVSGVLLHICGVEFRYAQRLNQEEVTPWQQFPTGPVDTIFQLGKDGRRKLRQFAQEADDAKLAQGFTFSVPHLGEIKTSFRKCLTHAILHSVRHWAQLATDLRRAGYKQEWPHDFIFSKAME